MPYANCFNFFGSFIKPLVTPERHQLMTTTPTFSLTNESATVILDGQVHTVQAGTPQYTELVRAISMQDWGALAAAVTLSGALQRWLGDMFTVDGETIRYRGEPMPALISQRIWSMAQRGESPEPLFNFYTRLQRNPSFRSVNQLFSFLANGNIPIEADGCFLAYKRVRADLRDHHSGTIANTPGAVIEMPRNQISDDPEYTCHVGLHVGAYGYLDQFHTEGETVICRVDPEHVVCVPKDYHAQKMRVCKYEVVGFHSGNLMPSTTIDPDFVPPPQAVVDFENDADDEVDSVVEDDAGDEVDVSGEAGAKIENDAGDEDDAGAEDDAKGYYLRDANGDIVDTDGDIVGFTEAEAKAKERKRLVRFNRLSPAQLHSQSIEDLRKYASTVVGIVGASKMSGGKAGLVSRIFKIRGKGGRSLGKTIQIKRKK
jgi:hypothetical protein